MRRTIVQGLLAASLLVGLAATSPAEEAKLTCKTVPELARAYLRKHVSHRRLAEEIRVRTAEAYLERIDPSKTLLLESEAEKSRDSLLRVFDEAGRGDCQRLNQLNDRILVRYMDLEEWVKAEVGRDDFELDSSVELVIDPDERGWPKTPEERRTLNRRLIHFQLANYLSAGTPLPEAREHLVHRYELFTRRARELDAEDLHAAFLDAFASALDPHSAYFSADALEDFQISMTLSLEGIGVALSSRDGYSIVERILPGGAADRAGSLRPNDRIIAVAQGDGEPVNVIDMALRDVVRLIRGKRGTPVRLTVLRDKDTRLSVTIVRDKIDLEDQAAQLRFETVPVEDGELKLAVIELTSFYGDKEGSQRQCTDDFERLLAQVKREKADGLLLDLSRNGGGLLDYAVEISGFFLKEGAVVAVRDRNGPIQMLRDPNKKTVYAGPLVVLTSRASASASEILAGALKDYQRAVIVGDDHTFGKGTVQTVVPLPEGLGAIKVTTALFFRPGGFSTQRSGVRSDVTIPSLLNTDEFGEKSHPHALPPQKVDAFLAAKANAPKPPQHWEPVTLEVLTELANRSSARVDSSSAFQAIEEELAEKKSRNGKIRIADVLEESATTAETEAGDSGNGAGPTEGGDVKTVAAIPPTPPELPHESEEEESRPSPQVEEALRILADLVLLQR
jgi:carboxyl-terminal processing protease